MGGSMTAISLGQAARPSRLGMRAITAASKVGRLSRDSGRYLVGPVQLREQLEMGNITSRPQEFAGGQSTRTFADSLSRRLPPPACVCRKSDSTILMMKAAEDR